MAHFEQISERLTPAQKRDVGRFLSWVEAAGIAAAAAVRSQLKHRRRTAGLPGNLRPHSFRVLVVTDLLEQGVPLEDVQTLVGHSQP